MRIQRNFAAAIAGLFLMSYSFMAFAVYGQQIIIESADATALQGQTISFTSTAGESVDVQVESSGDGRTVVSLTFDGNRTGGQSETGNLTIGSGANATVIGIPSAAAGEAIIVDLDAGVARTETGPSMPGIPSTPGWKFSIGPYVSDLTVPEIGTSGVVSEGGSERFNFAGIDGVDMTGADLSLSRNLGGPRNKTWYGSARFGSGDDQASAVLPTMTTNTALVFTDFVQTVTGIGIFPVGLDSIVDLDVDSSEFSLGYQFDLQGEPGQRHHWTPKFELTFGQLEIEQNSIDTLIDPAFGGSNPSVSRNQVLDQTSIEAYVGIRLTREMNDRLALFVEGGPIIRSLDADLTSVESIQCVICGAPLTGATVLRSDSESGTSFGGQAKAGIEFRSTDRVSVMFNLFYRGGVDNGNPINPQSGDDLFIDNLPTFLGTEKSAEFGAVIAAQIAF